MGDDERFVDWYGPWALVVGASEGIGATLAETVARQGLGVVLVARRSDALEAVAEAAAEAGALGTRAVAVNLTDVSAVPAIIDATSDIDIGLVFYAAGADQNYERFLARAVDEPVALVEWTVSRRCGCDITSRRR